jgi:hypothetical protein
VLITCGQNVDNSYLTFRCQNRKAHERHGEHREGNVVAFLGKKSILFRCPDSSCRSWVQLEFNFNGLDIDLQKAGFTQTVVLPGSIDLKTKKAAVVIGGAGT